MKKVRYMLVAIATIAMAGGTLAFKARFTDDICTGAAITRPDNVKTCFLTNAQGQITSRAICSVKVNNTSLITPAASTALALCYTEISANQCVDTDDCVKATLDDEMD